MIGRGMRGDLWAGGHVTYLDLDASYKICSLNEIYLVPLLSFFVILNKRLEVTFFGSRNIDL